MVKKEFFFLRDHSGNPEREDDPNLADQVANQSTGTASV